MNRKTYLLLFVLGTCIPLLLYVLNWLNGFSGAMAYDSEGYVTLAKNMVDHQVFSMTSNADQLLPDCFRTPGYPSYLSVFYILGLPLPTATFLQIAFAGLNVVLLSRISHRLIQNKWLGTLGGVILALDLPTAVAANQIMTELLTTTLLLVVANGLLSSNKWWTTMGTGLSIGAVVLVRPGCLLILPFVLLLPLLYQPIKWRITATVTVIALIMISPWVYRNHQIFDEVFLADVGLATTLFYIGSDVEATAKAKPRSEVLNHHMNRIRNDYDWTDLSSIKKSRADNRRIIHQQLSTAPGSAFIYYFKNLFFGLSKPSNTDLKQVTSAPSFVVNIAIAIQIVLLLAVYTIGAIGAIKQPKSIWAPTTLLLMGIILCILLPIGITEVTARFRVPAYPFIVLLSLYLGKGQVSCLHDRIVALKQLKTA